MLSYLLVSGRGNHLINCEQLLTPSSILAVWDDIPGENQLSPPPPHLTYFNVWRDVSSNQAFNEVLGPYIFWGTTTKNAFVISTTTYERRLLFKLIWKAAFVWVTPYLVQLTFSLEACSWKNGDLVFQRWSFFSILETCMGIDDPYVKKPRWRRNWNAISKMIKDGLAEGMVTRKLCVEVLDLVLTSFQTSFFQGIMNRNVPTRLESTWLD